jgi:hypothetical protein
MHPVASEEDLRRMALETLENALNGINEEQRQAMYGDARSLLCLRDLSSFLFDRLILAFASNSDMEGPVCSVTTVRELLIHLNNILSSMKTVPPMPLLESLFVFQLQSRISEEGFNINRESRNLLLKAENFLRVIREFNRTVPLTLILRCACRDLAFNPKPIAGGEEWLAIYRDFWKRRIDTLFREFLYNRKQREVLELCHSFFKDTRLQELENAPDNQFGGYPLRGLRSLSFLLSFSSIVFSQDINPILRFILINGDFRRRENKAEFTDSYNTFIKLEEEIRAFDTRMAPDGDFSLRFAQAKADMGGSPFKRRKAQTILEDISQEAERIVLQTKNAAESMIHVLGGILEVEPKSKYDTLVNLFTLIKSDGHLQTEVQEIIPRFKQMIRILDNISVLESMI